jgi:general secretion pathway protein C
MVAGIAYTIATSVLYFLSAPPGSDIAGASGKVAGASGSARAPADIDINALLSRNLFGAVDAEAIEAQADESPTVATRLPLELKGVFVAELEEESVAIISQKGKGGELYTVGAVLPGNATLVEVLPDHVVLRRAGAREALYFPEQSDSGWARTANDDELSAPSSADPALYSPEDQSQFEDITGISEDPDSGAGAEAEDMEDVISAIRDQVDADPAAALDALGITPVEEGGASGYRLGNLAQSPYLSQTGLQAGDVIVSVNGRPVGDLNQDRMELDNVLAQGSARLEVQRGNRRFFVTASLK